MKRIVIIVITLASLSIAGCTTTSRDGSCSQCILYFPGIINESAQEAANRIESRCKCKLVKDPVSAMLEVLPEGWSVDVRHNARLSRNVDKKGTAIHVVKKGQKYPELHNLSATLYIMPPDCENPAAQAGRASFPPIIVAVPSNARIYLRGETPFTAELLKQIINRK